MMKSLGLIRKAEMTKNKDVVFLARKSSLPGSTLAKILEGKYDTWYENYDAILEKYPANRIVSKIAVHFSKNK